MLDRDSRIGGVVVFIEIMVSLFFFGLGGQKTEVVYFICARIDDALKTCTLSYSYRPCYLRLL